MTESAKNYTLGRGKLFFDQFTDSTSKVKTGERYIGNTPQFGVTIASTALDHFDGDNGIKTKDDSITLELNRTGTFDTDNIDSKNVALFILGNQDIATQEADTALTQDLGAVLKGRYYQIGATDDNPSGVRDVSNVTVSSTDGVNAANRAASTPYLVGDFYVPATPNSHYYKCTVAGTSASSAPSFTTNGSTYTDGTATFKDMGLIAKTETDDYTVDLSLARLFVVETSDIADGTTLTVDYDQAARSREVIISASNATVEGALRFVATNPKGKLIDYYMPYVRLAPNGEFQLKGDDWQKLSFNIEVLKLNDTTEAIYADGRPYIPS